MSGLITKQEYEAKATELAKQMIEFAMLTKEFNQTGCYTKEFVKVGEKELTLAVMDENWVLI